MPDNGFFQINDIELNIAPEQIAIQRNSINNQWRTLRTSASMKSKSGFSSLVISLNNIAFTDSVIDASGNQITNGFEQLQNLVAQLRLVPFCWVENHFLRNSLTGGNNEKAMVLALKEMRISKDTSTTNVIYVSMVLEWFNYFPYTPNYTFKKDFWLPDEVINPKDSLAWNLLYRAEKAKHDYPVVSTLNGRDTTVFKFKEFAQMSLGQYQQLELETETLKRLRADLASSSTRSEDADLPMAEKAKLILEEILKNDAGVTGESDALFRKIFGDVTSFNQSEVDGNDVLTEILQILDHQLNPVTSSEFNPVVDDTWDIKRVNNGEHVHFKGRPDATIASEQELKFFKTDTLLMQRDKQFNFKEENIAITGINVVIQHQLSAIGLIGHPYPTFQSIGGADVYVTMSCKTVNEDTVKALVSFYDVIETQAHKNRIVPSGHRNLFVHNDILKMFGLRYFIPESIEVETNASEIGTYNLFFTFTNNPLDPTTQEQIQPGQQFVTKSDLRMTVINILNSMILFQKDNVYNRTNQLPEWLKGDPSEVNAYGEAPSFLTPKSGQTIYTPTLNSGNLRNNLLAEKLKIYRTNLEALFKKMLKAIQHIGPQIGVDDIKNKNQYGQPSPYTTQQLIKKAGEFDPIAAFFLLTDLDVPGIQRVQQDLLTVMKSGFYTRGYFKDPLLNNPAYSQNKLHQENDFILKRESGKYGTYHDEAWVSSLEDDQLNAEALFREAAVNKNFERQAAIQAANQLAEASKSFVLNDTALKSLQSTIGEVRRAQETKYRVGAVSAVTELLSEWNDFVVDFADILIFENSHILDLPEFTKVRELQRQISMDASSDSYRDFPLNQILKILQEEKPEVIKGLETALIETGQINKNIRITSLIQPDFYLYNRAFDTTNDIVPPYLIQGAIEAIKVSHGTEKLGAEKSWFKDLYGGSVITGGRNDRIKENIILDMANDEHKVHEALKTATLAKYDEIGFVPDDLQGYMRSFITEHSSDEPIVLSAINTGEGKTDDKFNLFTNSRPAVALRPGPYSGSIQHRFGLESIDYFTESNMTLDLPGDTLSPGEVPEFDWPTDPGTRILTSPWNPNRLHPVLGTRRPHKGIDLSARGGSNGHRVLAAADGQIIAVTYSPTESKPGKEYGGEGIRILIRHGRTGYITKYFHMQWDVVKHYSDIFWRKGSYHNIDEETRNELLRVGKGQQIGTIGSTGIGSGPHLHFEVWHNKQDVNPLLFLPGSPTNNVANLTKSKDFMLGMNPTNESLLTRSIDQLENETLNGQGYSMKRAYPTFRLYFIESDLGERKRYGFDDFFSYSSVTEISVIRSRKIAADLATIELTNISGVLNNRRFKDQHGTAIGLNGKTLTENVSTDDFSKNTKNTVQENPMLSLMLQPGVQIQLRMGYSNNPEDLDRLFNGVITDVQFSEGTDIVRIIAQSFAIELVQNIHGEVKEYGGWLSSGGRTSRILEELLAEPQVVHFGRWEGGIPTNQHRSLLRKDWQFFPSPQDDNIFAPTGSRGWNGMFDSTKNYVLYQATVWDVFQEMTYRHPAYITHAVPYEGKFGPRMTMFFGLPDQLYFARDPDWEEDSVSGQLKQIVDEANKSARARAEAIESLKDPSAWEALGQALLALVSASAPADGGLVNRRANALDAIEDPELLKQLNKEKDIRAEWLEKQLTIYGKNQGFIRPFRSYHTLTSTQHIIANSINSSRYSTFNVATIQYSDNSAEVDTSTGSLAFGDLHTFTLQADAGIPDEEKRETFLQFPNCAGYEMAKRYALSSLWKSAKEGYSGQLIILGNPGIKPYDICYIFDEYSDMFGPVEVEQVIHRFSLGTGFVTEITPDMVCHVNQESTMSTSDAMSLMVEGALKSQGLESLSTVGNAISIAGTGATVAAAATGTAAAAAAASPLIGIGAGLLAVDRAFSPIASMFFNTDENSVGSNGSTSLFGTIGAFMFRKLITRSQMAHPMRYSPLVLNGKPMLGGLPSRTVDGSFIAGIKRWFKDTQKSTDLYLDKLYDNLSIEKWAGHSQGDFGGTWRGEHRNNG